MKPLEPTVTGRFFDYPAGATGQVLPYWLAGGGTLVRMTPACKKAFCATMEAAIERSVAIANAESSFIGADYKGADWGASQTSAFSAVDLGVWELSGDRAAIASAFCRGCPKEDMNNLVETTWALWRDVNPYTIHAGQRSAAVYAWQTSLWAQQDGAQWQPDLSAQPIEITWSFSVGQTPCDSEWTEFGRQIYAPWGTYTGPRWPSPDAPMNWLSGELGKLDREHTYIPLSVFAQTPMQQLLEEGTMNPEVLGLLEEGKLGNWMSGRSQSTVRRSSSEWAVLQSMLANMKYTALVWDYVGVYRSALSGRRYDRGWGIDPYTFDINCWELPMSADTLDTSVDDNFLISRSDIDYMHGAAGYDFKFFLPSQDYENLVLNYRPMYGLADFPYAKQYAAALRVPPTGGEGRSTVFLTRQKTFELVEARSYGPTRYPAQPFDAYLQRICPPNFVDDRKVWDPYGDGMEDYEHCHRVVQEQPHTDTQVPVFNHCKGLLDDELPGPRGFPEPGPIGDVAAYNRQWWGEWQLYYPEQPNWPADDPNPTKWAPIHIVSPGDAGRCHFMEYDPTLGGYSTEWGGAFFGTFEVAFPDYPYGWDRIDHTELRCSGTAMGQHEWQFKAMPAGGA